MFYIYVYGKNAHHTMYIKMECDCLCQDMISIELKLKSKSAGGPSPHLRVLLGRKKKSTKIWIAYKTNNKEVNN